METLFVDGSSDHLISDLAGSALDVAFVATNIRNWEDGSHERVVVALPENHPLSGRDVVRWDELRNESLSMPQRGPRSEFLKLLISKIGHADPCRFLRQDVGLDRLLTHRHP